MVLSKRSELDTSLDLKALPPAALLTSLPQVQSSSSSSTEAVSIRKAGEGSAGSRQAPQDFHLQGSKLPSMPSSGYDFTLLLVISAGSNTVLNASDRLKLHSPGNIITGGCFRW